MKRISTILIVYMPASALFAKGLKTDVSVLYLTGYIILAMILPIALLTHACHRYSARPRQWLFILCASSIAACTMMDLCSFIVFSGFLSNVIFGFLYVLGIISFILTIRINIVMLSRGYKKGYEKIPSFNEQEAQDT